MKTQTSDSQAAMKPADALEILREGNKRFVASQRADRNLMQQMNETTGGQWPFAAVLGCIDSRAPAEHVFDLGIGDIFNARIAGNCVTPEITGSLEFACKVAGAKAIVVLGHTHCGAVKGACDKVEMGNLTKLLACITPAVDGTAEPADAAQRNSGNAEFVQSVAERNVRMAVDNLSSTSPVLAEMKDNGEIAIVGAMYDITTGAVTFLD